MRKILIGLIWLQVLLAGTLFVSLFMNDGVYSGEWLLGVIGICIFSFVYWCLCQGSLDTRIFSPIVNGLTVFIFCFSYPFLQLFDAFQEYSALNLALGAGAGVFLLSWILKLNSSISIGFYTGLWLGNIYAAVSANKDSSFSFDTIAWVLGQIYKPSTFQYVMIHYWVFLAVMVVAFFVSSLVNPKRKFKTTPTATSRNSKGFGTTYPRSTSSHTTLAFDSEYSSYSNDSDYDDYRRMRDAEESEHYKRMEEENDAFERERRMEREREEEQRYREHEEYLGFINRRDEEERQRREEEQERWRAEEERREEYRRQEEEEYERRRQEEEEEDRRKAEEEAEWQRRNDGLSWKVDAADDELGRSQWDRDEEDDRWGYRR